MVEAPTPAYVVAMKPRHARALAISTALLAPALVGAGAILLHAAAGAPLVDGETVTIPSSKGKFDFLEIDGPRRRLLAAHEEDGTADFIDLETRRLISRVKVGGAPVHVATDPKTGKYFVSAQEGKRVAVLDGSTLKETNSIALDGALDAILFHPKTRKLYVAHDDETHLWVIDADAEKVMGAVPIPAGPEYMVVDPRNDRIYLNIKTTHEVVVIDPQSSRVVAHWPTAPATRPHGLALDASSGRLFSAGDNGKLVVIDTKTGKAVATADIANKVDQIAFDPSTHRIYCAGPDALSVVQVKADGVTSLGSVKTAPTAKNVAVDPRTHAVWITYTDGVNSYAKSFVQP
jgi:DNA-binding beta-propeller fold protein YncE